MGAPKKSIFCKQTLLGRNVQRTYRSFTFFCIAYILHNLYIEESMHSNHYAIYSWHD